VFENIIGEFTPKVAAVRLLTVQWDIWHVWGRRERCTVFWFGDLEERDNLEDQGVDGNIIIIKWI